jgi:hypothetical protein
MFFLGKSVKLDFYNPSTKFFFDNMQHRSHKATMATATLLPRPGLLIEANWPYDDGWTLGAVVSVNKFYFQIYYADGTVQYVKTKNWSTNAGLRAPQKAVDLDTLATIAALRHALTID